MNFSRRTNKEEDGFGRDFACFFPLSLSLFCLLGVGGVSRGPCKKKKKKIQHARRVYFCRREQRFPRFNTCKASVVAVVIARVAVQYRSHSNHPKIVRPFVVSFCTSVYKLKSRLTFLRVVLKFISSVSFFSLARQEEETRRKRKYLDVAL